MPQTRTHGRPVQIKTPNITAEQRARLREIFPQTFTEGKLNLEKLREDKRTT